MADGSWSDQYLLMLTLHQEAAEAAGICGNYGRMAELAALIHGHAAGILDEVPVYETEIRALTAQGELLPAIRLGLSVLERLGMRLPENPSQEEVGERLGCALALLQAQTIEKLIHLPPMTSPAQLACASILSQLGEPAYAASPQFFLVWASVMAETSLRHGNCALSPFAYAAYALALCATGAHVETGSKLAKAAIAMLEPLGAQSLRCRLLNIYGCTIQPWTGHLRDTLSALGKAIASAPESGDFTSGSYAAFNTCTAAFFMGEPLDELVPRLQANMDAIAGMRQTYIWNWVAFHYVAVQRLRGAAGQIAFDEESWLASAKAANDQCGLAYYFLGKLMTACLLGETVPGEAMAQLAEMKVYQAGFQGAFAVPVSYFYGSLALLKFGQGDGGAALEEVRANRVKLEGLARLAPMNFQHKCDLIGAELARIEGKPWDAARLYETAIAGARKNGFVQEEALACELASAFYLGCGMETAAQLHLRSAREGYIRWQAREKVRALPAAGLPYSLQESAAASPDAVMDALDLSSVMKATRAISCEMELDRLLAEVMRIVIENAGAQRGVLLLQENEVWQVTARGRAGASQVEIPHPVDTGENGEVSAGVIRYVARTKERVLLEDAASYGKFVSDPYIRRQMTRSLLCAPLLSRGNLIGILYLENSLTAGAFTPGKVQLLELILSQAAISLENARVFKALRKSEAKYRRIVDTANEGIWLLGPDTLTVFVNARMAEMLGCSVDEMAGLPVTAFMFEEDAHDHLKRMEDRRGGLAKHYERRFRRKDGETVWVLVSAASIFDDEHRFQGAIAMATDITERRRAEDDLRLMNERFALATAAARMGVWDWYIESDKLVWDDGMYELYGMKRGDFAGAYDAWLQGVHPDDRALAHEAITAAIRGEREYDVEFRVVWPSGAIHYIKAYAQTVRDAQGKPLRMTGVNFDITGRKRAEAEVLRLNAELEQRVADRTAALELANKELESFSYSVSHDLRTPLRAIDGFSRMLQEEYDAVLGEEGRRYTHTISNNAVRMGQLISAILDFSRMSRREIAAAPVDMTALAQEVYGEVRAAAQAERNIVLHMAGLPPASGDPALLRQVWVNLLSNAVKYTGQRPEAVIEVGSSVAGGEITYWVKDNGVGFDMRFADKLFGVFQRLHTAEEFEGTGIGLAIVKRIVTRHGGRVWAESKLGEGTTMYFALPAPKEGNSFPPACGRPPWMKLLDLRHVV